MGKSAAASTKADTAVKLVLIFFISLLSFTVGTYVGKQVSDSDYRRAALEGDYNHSSLAGTEQNEKSEDPSTQPIKDEEVASLTQEFIRAERNVASEGDAAAKPDAHEPAPTPAGHDGYKHISKSKAETAEEMPNEIPQQTTDMPKPVPTPKAAYPTKKPYPTPASTTPTTTPTEPTHGPSKAASRVANDMAPAPDVKKPREPSSVLPTVATTAIGKYTVQVASYATEQEAKTQASRLTEKGYSAFYVSADVNGRSWYRVSVGLFSDQKSASNYRTELLATQVVQSAIVQKIVK